MNVTAIIPARYASTRFPGKPLADILGKPMIQHVYERTCRAEHVDRVIVATDDMRISDAVQAFGGTVVMTREDHATGTDRLAEVASGLECEHVVNVQGDEPLIEPHMITQAIAPLLADRSIPMGTLRAPIADIDEYSNPNVVKVVCDEKHKALYFSRSSIPFSRELAVERGFAAWPIRPFRHIGLYVYRRDFLLRYPLMAPTPLERLECLEQLRALEHGFQIHVAETDLPSQGVDTPEDLEKVISLLRGR